MNLSKIIVFDTETTGFGHDDEIIQLSIIDGTGKILFNELLSTKNKTDWKEAEAVNHISPEMVKDKKHITEYKAILDKIFNDCESMVGYNISFDIRMLQQNGIELPEKKTYDVMKAFSEVMNIPSTKHIGSKKWFKLIDCARYYNFEKDENCAYHDALTDVYATLHCFKKIKSKYYL